MKAWWAARAPRERMILASGAVAMVIILVWLLAWEPLASQSSSLRESIATQEQDLAWMRDAAGEVIAMRSQGEEVAGLQGRSLLAVVDQSARQAGLADSLKRVEPEGSDKVRVRFESVAFDAFIIWLYQMSTQFGVSVSQVSIDPEEATGRVTVRLTLNAGLA